MSVATLGWELAVWRLGATPVLSLSAGVITHFIVGRGWLGGQFVMYHQLETEQLLLLGLIVLFGNDPLIA